MSARDDYTVVNNWLRRGEVSAFDGEAMSAELAAIFDELDRLRTELEALHADRIDTVVALVVAVDRYIDHRNEADKTVRQGFWQAMTAANEQVASAFNVYPLQGFGDESNPFDEHTVLWADEIRAPWGFAGEDPVEP